jgi:hypothetical protein
LREDTVARSLSNKPWHQAEHLINVSKAISKSRVIIKAYRSHYTYISGTKLSY